MRATYEWANDVAPVELPGRIADAFALPTYTYARTVTDPSRAAGALARLLDDLAATPAGNRNRRTRDVAYFAGRLCGAGLLDDGEAFDLVLDHCPLAADFGESEAANVIARGLRDGAREPLEARGERGRVPGEVGRGTRPTAGCSAPGAPDTPLLNLLRAELLPGAKVADLTVLLHTNDPYRHGSTAHQVAAAQWVARAGWTRCRGSPMTAASTTASSATRCPRTRSAG